MVTATMNMQSIKTSLIESVSQSQQRGNSSSGSSHHQPQQQRDQPQQQQQRQHQSQSQRSNNLRHHHPHHRAGANSWRLERIRSILLRQKQAHCRELQKLRAELSQPNAELVENNMGIRLQVDLPGVLSNDVQVNIDQNVLTILATRKHLGIMDDQIVKTETICRRYAVNCSLVDTDQLEASLVHGVLTVRAPKKGMAAVQQAAATVAKQVVQQNSKCPPPHDAIQGKYSTTTTTATPMITTASSNGME